MELVVARMCGQDGQVTRRIQRNPRCLVNDFMVEHGPSAPAAYPEINNATRPLRAAAGAAGEPQRMSLYAGTGYRLARAMPVEEVVADLVSGLPG